MAGIKKSEWLVGHVSVNNSWLHHKYRHLYLAQPGLLNAASSSDHNQKD